MRYYTPQDEWIEVEGGTATVGITAYAQGQLGDIVFVELPEPGRAIRKGQDVAVVESVKTAADVYAPVSGTVTEVNAALADNPGLVNQSAEAEGWFFRLRLADPAELEGLMDKAAYEAFLGTR